MKDAALSVCFVLCCLTQAATVMAQSGNLVVPKKDAAAKGSTQQSSVSQAQRKTDQAHWVDLGLPSGTLWKDRNERMCNWKEARSRYAKQLPTRDQFDELLEYCEVSVEGAGIRFTAPNGNSIILPAEGEIGCKGNRGSEGEECYYWLMPEDPSEAWFYYFDLPELVRVQATYYKHCYGRSVRLVKGGSR